MGGTKAFRKKIKKNVLRAHSATVLWLMRDQTDLQLVNQYRNQKCDKAFEVLVERYLPMVYGVCFRVLNNQTEADHASHAVFVALALQTDGLNGPDGLPTWLHAMARAVSVDVVHDNERRRARQIARFGSSEISLRAPHSNERLESLDVAVEALPKPMREVVIRYYLLGWPILRMADTEGVSPSVLRMILARADERLSKSLELKSTFAVAELLTLVHPSRLDVCEIPQPALVMESVQSALLGIPSAGPLASAVGIARELLKRWAAWRTTMDSAVAVGIGAIVGAIMAFTIPGHVGPGTNVRAEIPVSREAVASAAAPAARAVDHQTSLELQEDHPLIRAAKTCYDREQLLEFKQVLDHTSEPIDGIRDQFGRTPLHWASLSCGQETVLLLLMRGASVNARDMMGKTSLTYAVETNQGTMLLQFLLVGGNPNVVAIDQSTPLAWAALNDKPKLCEILLWTGAELHPSGVEGRWEPLEAARRGGGEKVRKLFERYVAGDSSRNTLGLSAGAGKEKRRAIFEVLKNMGSML